jgi:integrase
MARKNSLLVYQRENGRYYADLRSYRDALGGRTGRHTALVAPGEKLATRDRAIALKLGGALVSRLEAARQKKALFGDVKETTLSDFAGQYLVLKKVDGKVGDGLLEWAERVALPRAIAFFGPTKKLQQISVTEIREWAEWLSKQIGARKTCLGPQTVRHHLNLISNLFRYAQQEGFVAGGHNPVAQLVCKPTGTRHEAKWLDVVQAARFLEAARCVALHGNSPDFLFPVIATLLLTGARKSEGLGLELEDIDLDRQTVRIRPNSWRTLKTRTSDRTVPLWPQLAAVLAPHVATRIADEGRTSELLFATIGVAGKETMIVDLRKALQRTGLCAGLPEKYVTTKVFRHTYCAARLQTLDNGAPVSPFTVARELGHGGDSMVKAVYGHLGTVRHRSGVVEYLPPVDSIAGTNGSPAVDSELPSFLKANVPYSPLICQLMLNAGDFSQTIS